MTPEQEALREKVMREFTGHIASTCCHRTGGVNDDPKCECRVLADAAIAVVLKEASRGFENNPLGCWSGARVAYDILSLIPQEEGE